MPKPPGLSMSMVGGLPRFQVTPIDRVTDQIWDAVREAINSNMTPQQFKCEAADAWESHLKEDAKDAAKELNK